MVLAVIVLLTLGGSRVPGSMTVVGGSPDQRAMVRWAGARFETVGLGLPSLEVRFHADRAECGDRLGYYHSGIVDVCRHHTDVWAARDLLHEMAHGWLDANLAEADRERFLKLRGLSTWNDPRVAWDERGFEQAAEIMAWAIGDQGEGIMMPSIPDNDSARLTAAYRVLTGMPFPISSIWADGSVAVDALVIPRNV